jgi:hypothetical protein
MYVTKKRIYSEPEEKVQQITFRVYPRRGGYKHRPEANRRRMAKLKHVLEHTKKKRLRKKAYKNLLFLLRRDLEGSMYDNRGND